jgi:hypothetical protein
MLYNKQFLKQVELNEEGISHFKIHPNKLIELLMHLSNSNHNRRLMIASTEEPEEPEASIVIAARLVALSRSRAK